MRSLFQFFSIGFVVILFTACEPDISFTEPQPSEKGDESKFKLKFRGQFLCLEDSSILVIAKTSIVQKWHFEIESENDSIIEIKHGIGNFKYDADVEDLVIKSNADSTHFIIDYNKKIFQLSETNILKYDKGIYFLNSKKRGNNWDVKILHFSQEGSLLLKDLELNKEDLERLKAITEVEVKKDIDGDVTEYKLQPTRKELKEILASGFFEEGEEFVRIKR